MELKLDGRTALVTGASSGLGPYISRALDQAGASVAIHYHANQSGAESLAATLKNRSTVVQADLADAAAVEQLYESATSNLGPISVLVNCAAAESQDVSDLADLSAERWGNTQKTNVDAPMILTRLFAAAGNAGSVVNISSIEASRPAQGHGHYATSKAALEMLTRAAALELGPRGIRVNAVAPGLIWREGIDEGWPEGVEAWKAAAPLGRLVQPEDVANTVLFLASDAAASISGTVVTVDCGLSVKPGW